MDQTPEDAAADAELQSGPTSDQISLQPGPGEDDAVPAPPPDAGDPPPTGDPAMTDDPAVTGDLGSGADPATEPSGA